MIACSPILWPIRKAMIGMINFFLGLLLGLQLQTHDYYVSTTSIKWVPEKSQIQLTSRFFIDDIEAFMQSQTNSKVQFQPDSDVSSIDIFLSQFYLENMSIELDQELQQIVYLGREYQEDLLVIYAEVLVTSVNFSQANFRVKFLTKFLSGQQNIVHFQSPEINKSYLLSKNKAQAQLSLKIKD